MPKTPLKRPAELEYTPANCHAHAEHFIRSIKTECLDRVVPLGERHLRHLVREPVDDYRTERNHQGIGNGLIERPPDRRTGGDAVRRLRRNPAGQCRLAQRRRRPGAPAHHRRRTDRELLTQTAGRPVPPHILDTTNPSPTGEGFLFAAV